MLLLKLGHGFVDGGLSSLPALLHTLLHSVRQGFQVAVVELHVLERQGAEFGQRQGGHDVVDQRRVDVAGRQLQCVEAADRILRALLHQLNDLLVQLRVECDVVQEQVLQRLVGLQNRHRHVQLLNRVHIRQNQLAERNALARFVLALKHVLDLLQQLRWNWRFRLRRHRLQLLLHQGEVLLRLDHHAFVVLKLIRRLGLGLLFLVLRGHLK